MAIVVPAPGELTAVAQRLLALADHPRDVRTTGNGLQFEVPDELADRYHGADKTSSVSYSEVTTLETPDPAPARPVKRRGRPPRVNVEG